MAIPRQFQGLSLGNNPYATAAIQGTGINPIHAVRDSLGGRNTAPDGSLLVPARGLVEPDVGDGYGYMSEDMVSMYDGQLESPTETGIADRPTIDREEGWRAQTTPGYPSFQPTPVSGTSGNAIRSEDHGAESSYMTNVVPFFNGPAGWQNKLTGDVLEPGSGISSPDQYTVQTSMQQLHQTRAGSQRGNVNSDGQSEYDAPIATRVPGMKVKAYSESYRLTQMLPRTARVIQRPFWNRRAGTGHVGWLGSNSKYLVQPLDREAPPDPYQGATVGSGTGNQYGYTDEDYTY